MLWELKGLKLWNEHTDESPWQQPSNDKGSYLTRKLRNSIPYMEYFMDTMDDG